MIEKLVKNYNIYNVFSGFILKAGPPIAIILINIILLSLIDYVTYVEKYLWISDM